MFARPFMEIERWLQEQFNGQTKRSEWPYKVDVRIYAVAREFGGTWKRVQWSEEKQDLIQVGVFERSLTISAIPCDGFVGRVQ
jgi:hypothetical protein